MVEVTFTQLSHKCRGPYAHNCSRNVIFKMSVKEQAPTVHLQKDIRRCIEANRCGGQRVKGGLYYSENVIMVLALNRFWLLSFSLLVNTSDWKNGILVFFVPLWIKKWSAVYITWGFGGALYWRFYNSYVLVVIFGACKSLKCATLHMNHKLFCSFTKSHYSSIGNRQRFNKGNRDL